MTVGGSGDDGCPVTGSVRCDFSGGSGDDGRSGFRSGDGGWAGVGSGEDGSVGVRPGEDGAVRVGPGEDDSVVIWAGDDDSRGGVVTVGKAVGTDGAVVTHRGVVSQVTGVPVMHDSVAVAWIERNGDENF